MSPVSKHIQIIIIDFLYGNIYCKYNYFLFRGKWACFGRQDSQGKSIFSETLRDISIICGVFTRAQWADSSRYTAAKLGRAF